MTTPVIVDAGPALNFFASNKERILLSVLSPLYAPETVAQEVERKSMDRRLSSAQNVWRKLIRANRLFIISDEITPELSRAVERISGIPMANRLRQAKDLGEIMVIAHAAVSAEAGNHVIVLIDDGRGAALASAESRRLTRLAQQGRSVGRVRIMDTQSVLAAAAGGSYLPDRSTMRKVYKELRECDDGLVDIEQTILLSDTVWSARMRPQPT